MMILGFILIAIGTSFSQYQASFQLALFASIIVGVSGSFGESTTLGFCKSLPNEMVGYFGSGTGFAGIFGAGLIIAMKAIGLSSTQTFIIIIPSLLPYYLSFRWLTLMTKDLTSKLTNTSSVSLEVTLPNQDKITYHGIPSSPRNQASVDLDIVNQTLNTSQFSSIMKKVGYLQLNLMVVYFFEYAIMTCFCDRISRKIINQADSQTFITINGYSLMLFCYQVGVFISRSSLSFVKIRAVHIITLI